MFMIDIVEEWLIRAKRSKNKILQEILSICSNGENITQIAYRSNTNYTVVRGLIESLKENNLIEEIDGSPILYKTTAKGLIIKDRLKMLQEELNGVMGKSAYRGDTRHPAPQRIR
jgi:predicted transcriptional regulator